MRFVPGPDFPTGGILIEPPESIAQAYATGRGAFRLRALPEPDDDDPLLRASRVWASVTPYIPTRHPKRGEDADAFVREDIVRECLRRNLPRPQTIDLHLHAGPKGGLSAEARLTFAAAVSGPILLGRASHIGGGLFEAAS